MSSKNLDLQKIQKTAQDKHPSTSNFTEKNSIASGICEDMGEGDETQVSSLFKRKK